MSDDSDWFRFLLRILVTALLFCVLLVLGFVVGAAFLMSRDVG